MFHIIPAFAPDSTDLGVGMVQAAVAAGVRRFVFSGRPPRGPDAYLGELAGDTGHPARLDKENA